MGRMGFVAHGMPDIAIPSAARLSPVPSNTTTAASLLPCPVRSGARMRFDDNPVVLPSVRLISPLFIYLLSSQKAHPNAFLSLSTAINGRSPAHRALAAACAPDRLLVESDLNDARLGPAYTWHMLRTVAAVKGWRVEDTWDYSDEDAGEDAIGNGDHPGRWGAVRRLEANWRAFVRGDHKPRVRRKERRDRAIEEWEAGEESE